MFMKDKMCYVKKIDLSLIDKKDLAKFYNLIKYKADSKYQAVILIGEMSELTNELVKHIRDRKDLNFNDLVKEMAHVNMSLYNFQNSFDYIGITRDMLTQELYVKFEKYKNEKIIDNSFYGKFSDRRH